MNTVLTQELFRYNRLIESIHSSLASLKKALKVRGGGARACMHGDTRILSLPLAAALTAVLKEINHIQTWQGGSLLTLLDGHEGLKRMGP